MRPRTARAVVAVSARLAVTTRGRPRDAREVEDAAARLVIETGRPRAVTAFEDDSVLCTVDARRLRDVGRDDEILDPRDAVPDLGREAMDATLLAVLTAASRGTDRVLVRVPGMLQLIDAST